MKMKWQKNFFNKQTKQKKEKIYSIYDEMISETQNLNAATTSSII